MNERIFLQKGLSLDRLRVLLEVGECGSIAAAAQGDAVRQSQYSRQLKELDAFFGVALTRRVGRELKLTKEGGELCRLLQSTFRRWDDFYAHCRSLPTRYVIGAGDSLLMWLVAPLLSLSPAGKRWQFRMENLRNREVNDGLLNMDIDFGIMRTNAIAHEVLSHRVLCTVNYALYVPAGMDIPRVPKNLLMPALLEQYPLATLSRGTSFHESLKGAFREAGTELPIACETQSFPFAARLCASGRYMAILPDIAEPFLPQGVRRVNSKALASLQRDVALAWNPRMPEHRPDAAAVLDFLSEIAALRRSAQ